jgi:outer membrane scaffolding protein for murein synthesis (MipA/OmpV family)
MIARGLVLAVCLGLLLGLLAGSEAHAEGWVFTLGAQFGVTPPYEGANRDLFAPSPNFDLRPVGSPDRFTPPDSGTTFALYSNRIFEIGPILRFRFDRNDKGELQGFNKIDVATEPGVYTDIWPAEWLRLRLEGRHGVTGHYGWVGDVGVDLVYRGRRWDASLGPRLGWGDHRYMQTYFGVTPLEAARSPRIHEVYSPSAGQRYTGLESAIGYRIGRRWEVIADFGYQRLADDAAASPIVRKAGMADQYASSIGFTYTFGGWR